MLFILLGLLFIALIFLPQFWVRRVIAKHATPRPDFPGTGGELAEHLIEHFNLHGVGVERTDRGDHYDPDRRTVGLSPQNYDGASLSAVAIAAHEIGHALQHRRGDGLLSLRQKLAKTMMWTDRIGSLFFLVAPFLGLIAKAPAVFLLTVIIGLSMMGMRVVVHLVTLPMELDASFKKALPILHEGGYLREEDLPAARQVLKAAALTYVAGALMSLLDLARWIRVLR